MLAMQSSRPPPGPLRLVRATIINGQRVEAGQLVAVDAVLASELISAGKAVREKAEPPKAEPPKAEPPKKAEKAKPTESAP